MERQLLLRDVPVTQYLHPLVGQRDDFEPSGKGEGGIAYRVHQSVWGEIKIENGYEGYFCAMAMIEDGGGVMQKSEHDLYR
jgi:hypothetical protein